jgi:hypothetical protein
MNEVLSEEELRRKAWEALKERLGVANAMRFLSLVHNPSRDYQAWRDAHFKDLTTEALVEQMQAVERTPRQPSGQQVSD